MVSKRDLDPYALVYREGAWLVVGWCHLRQEIRSFRVDRIHEAVMAPKPKSPDFERPADFDVKAYAHALAVDVHESSRPRRSSSRCPPRRPRSRNEDFGPTAVKRHGRRPHAGHVRLREPRVRRDARARRQGRDQGDARRPAARADRRRARRDRGASAAKKSPSA